MDVLKTSGGSSLQVRFGIILTLTLLCARTAVASMSISATTTTITVTTSPSLPGSFGGHSWTALVGPMRYRDNHIITSGRGYGWAGWRCQGTIFSCRAESWVRTEQSWVTYMGSTTQTFARTDSDWQAGDTVCEGTAHTTSAIADWLPAPGYITNAGSCVALPDPRPVTCSINVTGDLSHGDLALADVVGSTTTVTAVLRCSGNKTVTIRAIRSPNNPTSTIPVRTDNSITSHLAVNGMDGAVGAQVPVIANQPVNVSLTSTLSSGIPSAGPLLGNAVLVTAE
jgi:hypothetical protein